MKLTYKQDPGYVLDLFNIFFLHYNAKECADVLINPDKKQEDLVFIQENIARFGSCPEELYPFFYYRENAFCFLMHYFYGKDADVKNENIDEVLETLELGTLSSALFAFYFPEEDPEGKSLEDIARLIRASSYSETLRYRLLNLFVEPEAMHRLLIEELKKKEPLLRKYYEEHMSLLLRTQAKVTEEQIRRIFSTKEGYVDLVSFEDCSFTLCLLNKNTIQMSDGLLVLGCDYMAAFESKERNSRLPDLVRMGKVFSEENRRKILDMIIAAGELCTGEIATQLKTSVTVIYYHLEMMASEGVLNFRTEGRTIIYRANPDYFRRSSELMLQYGRRIDDSQS